ncbi:hypothetical protein [Companilactobacillus sp. DQM5]|uniref:hypothetical protein n=1 Tax=Companilactobacillus sp. DQM5 TaxID=3463359 RepID=UPI0040586F05
MDILGVIILIYFIYKQYSFETPKRFTYLIIPIYSIIMFFITLKSANLIIILSIFIIGIIIGIFQGHYAKVKPYVGDSGKKCVQIKGGSAYLIGWVLILITEILIEIYLMHHSLSGNQYFSELKGSIVEELLPFNRIRKSQAWEFWILTGSASLMYTTVLSYRFPEFRQTIKKGARKEGRRAKKELN